MADYKIPNLCGTSVKFNAIQSKLDTMIDNAIDGLEVDASALKATMDTDVTSLVSDLKALVPELPALPDVNLQGQLTSLAGLAAGSGAYNTLLADVTSKFGSALTAGGFSLDTLVSDAASAISGGTDLCAAVPNFSVPAAGGDAVQKAVEVLQAEVDSLPEEPSTLLANANFTAAKTAVESKVAKMQSEGESTDVDVVKGTVTSKTPPTEDVAAFTVAEESKEVTFGGDGKTTKVKVTTPKQQAGKNVAPSDSGFTKRRRYTQERIKLKDVRLYTLTFAPDPTTGRVHEERVQGFDLSRTPISIAGVWGYTYDVPYGEFEPDAPLKKRIISEYHQAAVDSRGWPAARWGGRQVYQAQLKTYESDIGRGTRQDGDQRVYDIYIADGKHIDVTSIVWDWGDHSGLNKKGNETKASLRKAGDIFIVGYSYNDIYDPNFVDTDDT